MIRRTAILGVILAGGKASRMGGQDKALQTLGEESIIRRVIAGAAPQVAQLIISVNHHQERYEHLGLPLVADVDQAYAGPLAGIVSAMAWAESAAVTYSHLACFPGDVPWFPDDVVAALTSALTSGDYQMAWSRCAGQVQPLFSLWSLGLKQQLQQELAKGKVGPTMVIPRLRAVPVDFLAQDERSFFNINTVEDLVIAQKLLSSD